MKINCDFSYHIWQIFLFVDDIIVTVEEWFVKTGNATNYNFENIQESIESIWDPYYGMAISGIIMTIILVIHFAFELLGTIIKKDWIIIVSCGFRICFLLDLICITVILHLSGVLSRYTIVKSLQKPIYTTK